MKTLVGVLVSPPFTINDMAPGPLRNITRRLKLAGSLVGHNLRVGVGVRVVVAQYAEWLRLEVAPG